MTKHVIKVVKDFDPKPYGRTQADGDANGTKFRDLLLAPALREFDKVVVDLTGYNRYGRSFLDEAFGGLIRECDFTLEELERKLEYKHDLVKSIELVIRDRLEAAERDKRSR